MLLLTLEISLVVNKVIKRCSNRGNFNQSFELPQTIRPKHITIKMSETENIIKKIKEGLSMNSLNGNISLEDRRDDGEQHQTTG